ncbi:MAG TPA: hypothetical protein VHP11_06375 [Tepidisphaeraceae bacterium]|nr:hypothetical protein [Tepidisphaeraceae bacterium]
MRLTSTTLAAMLVLLTCAPAFAQDRNADRAFTEKYGLIVQRNIFARNRVQASQRPSEARNEAPPKPAQYLILTGIVRREDADGYFAFIEDTRAGTTSKVQVGQVLAQGTVIQIDFDSIQYEFEGKPIRVEIGKTLVGASSTPRASTTQPAGDSSMAQSPSRTESTSSEPSNDIAERMRQRRLQELKK